MNINPSIPTDHSMPAPAGSAHETARPGAATGLQGQARDEYMDRLAASGQHNAALLRKRARADDNSQPAQFKTPRTGCSAQALRSQPLNIRKMASELRNLAHYQPIPNSNDLLTDLATLRDNPAAIGKDHPFFCLKYIRKNKEIPERLLALKSKPEYPELKKEFIEAIKSTNWNEQPILSHLYMSAKFPDDEVAPLIENLALLVRQEGGHLSDTEMETFSAWLNFQEQYGAQKSSLYRVKAQVDTGVMKAIEQSPQAVEIAKQFVKAATTGDWANPLFTKTKVLTEQGASVALTDIALFARKSLPEEQFPAANFRLAYAWIDTLQHNNADNLKKEAPTLYPAIDRGRRQTIEPYLVHAPEIAQIAADLHAAINSKNLHAEVFKRNHVRNRLSGKMAEYGRDLSELPNLQEIVTALYQNNKYPPQDYPITMLWLQLREQYGDKICAPNTEPIGNETVWTQLATTKGEVTAHALFDENDKLTEKGDHYLTRVADAFGQSGKFNGYRIDRDAVEQRLRKLPANLRTFVEIDCGDAQHIKRNEDKKYWLAQFGDPAQTPQLGGMKVGKSPLGANDKPATLLFPSRAVARELDLQFGITQQKAGNIMVGPDKYLIEPRRVLGRLSGDRRDELRGSNVHPVLSMHPNVANHFIEPHDARTGVADASEHDAAFHTPIVNMMPQSTRTAMEKSLATLIRTKVKPEGEHQLAAFEALRTELGDLAFFANRANDDYEEKIVAQYCKAQLSGIGEREHYLTNEQGQVIESPKQVAYTLFYLKLLSALKQNPLMAPFGASPKSGQENIAEDLYKPVFSNQWKHVEKEIIDQVKLRAATMALYQWQATEKGKLLQEQVFARYPEPTLAALTARARAKMEKKMAYAG
ncbi:MAG: hypothetical protein V4754_22515 [Pseudomonadota bacterium]